MRSIVRWARALLLLPVLALSVTAQQSATIYGTLTSATTGQPVNGSVQANSAGFSGPNGSGSSDSRGNYSLSVPPGAYRLAAACGGECSAQFYGQKNLSGTGKLVPVKAGERVRIDFQLFPPSVITGRVVDEDGDPLSRVVVQIYNYRSGARGDKGELLEGMSVTTDDRGEYRLRVSSGGEYIVGIRERLGYPRIFFPGTTDPSAAQAVPVKPGTEVTNIDFKRRRIPGVTVRGVITPLGQSSRPVEVGITRSGSILVSPSEPAGRSLANADGTFEIRNVLPGDYDVYVGGWDPGSGTTHVQVGAAALNDVKIVLEQSIMLKGRISLKAPTQQPLSLNQITLSIDDVGGNGGAQARVGADGSFAFQPIRPGTYRMAIYGLRNGHIETATLGAQNALGDFTLTNARDSLELVIGFEAGRMEAKVLDSTGIPYPGAFVALIALPPRRGRVDSTYTGGTDSEGKITLTGVAPGSYELFAWEEQPRIYAGDLYNRVFLKQYEGRGTPVRVTIDATVESQVAIISVP